MGTDHVRPRSVHPSVRMFSGCRIGVARFVSIVSYKCHHCFPHQNRPTDKATHHLKDWFDDDGCQTNGHQDSFLFNSC